MNCNKEKAYPATFFLLTPSYLHVLFHCFSITNGYIYKSMVPKYESLRSNFDLQTHSLTKWFYYEKRLFAFHMHAWFLPCML